MYVNSAACGTTDYVMAWSVDTGFIQPEVEGRGSDSPRAEPSGYHA